MAQRAAPMNYGTHNLEFLEAELEKQGDSCLQALKPDAAARDVLDRMFRPYVPQFDMQQWLDHIDPLEVLLCYKHIADLKYGVDKDGREHVSCDAIDRLLVNARFLAYMGICAPAEFSRPRRLREGDRRVRRTH